MERFFFAAAVIAIALAGVFAATSHGGSRGLLDLAPRAEGRTAFTR